MVSFEKRNEYWNHFIEQWYIYKGGMGGSSVTGPQLRNIKPKVMVDNFFWNDVVACHRGLEYTPEQLSIIRPKTYEHCQGKFWGMIAQEIEIRRHNGK